MIGFLWAAVGKIPEFLQRGLRTSCSQRHPNCAGHQHPGGRGRKPGAWPHFLPCRKTCSTGRRLHGPAPRAESGKALWVPGKKGPSEISGTALARARVLSGGCLRRSKGSSSLAKVKAGAKNNRGASGSRRDTRSQTHRQTPPRTGRPGQTPDRLQTAGPRHTGRGQGS